MSSDVDKKGVKASKAETKMRALSLHLDDLRAQEKKLKESITDTQNELLTMMEKTSEFGLEFPVDGGMLCRASYTQAERTIWNSDALHEQTTPEMFARITKPVVIPEAVEEQVKLGNLTLDIVGACCEIVPNKPFVKITFVRHK